MTTETTIDLPSLRFDGERFAGNALENVQPIWEQLAALGESAPEGTWDNVPTDLSTRIDDLIYRRTKDAG